MLICKCLSYAEEELARAWRWATLGINWRLHEFGYLKFANYTVPLEQYLVSTWGSFPHRWDSWGKGACLLGLCWFLLLWNLKTGRGKLPNVFILHIILVCVYIYIINFQIIDCWISSVIFEKAHTNKYWFRWFQKTKTKKILV